MISEKIYITLFILVCVNFYFFTQNYKISRFFNLIDHPDKKRKIHKKSVPLTGGLYFFLNIILIFFLNKYYLFNDATFFDLYVIIFITLLLIFGLYDDKFNINPNFKLFLSIILFFSFAFFNEDFVLSEIVISSGYKFNLGNYSIPFTIFCLVIFQNAFNMYDGINLQNISYFILLLIIINFFYNKIDFLIYLVPALFFISFMNFKNKLFLGDSGSYILSFIIALLLIKIFNTSNNIFSDEVFLFLCIPGYDLLRLAVLRVLNKKHPFKGDRNHIHHLILKRLGYSKTIIYLNIICFVPIIYSHIFSQNLLAILISLILYMFTIYYFKNDKNYKE